MCVLVPVSPRGSKSPPLSTSAPIISVTDMRVEREQQRGRRCRPPLLLVMTLLLPLILHPRAADGATQNPRQHPHARPRNASTTRMFSSSKSADVSRRRFSFSTEMLETKIIIQRCNHGVLKMFSLAQIFRCYRSKLDSLRTGRANADLHHS